MFKHSDRAVAITGAGAGLGRDLALQLAAKGYIVFGTALVPDEVQAFDTFATRLNSMQGSGLDAGSAASRVIELAEQVPAPSRAPVGADAAEMLPAVREKSDAELDALRLEAAGLPASRASSLSNCRHKARQCQTPVI